MTRHLDEFSKSLANSCSRRESLRAFGAFLAGAVLSPLPLASAWAASSNACKTFCNGCPTRLRNQCLSACQACSGNTTRLCGSCGSYTCCGPGASCCGGSCADLASDFANCGACGYACEPPGPHEYGACIDGKCEYVCAQGAVRCNGICTGLGSDHNNCGACGNVCGGATPYCNNGTCVSVGCPVGQSLCYGSYCADLYNDSGNCGVCGVVCGVYENCTGGVCQPNDPPPPDFW